MVLLLNVPLYKCTNVDLPPEIIFHFVHLSLLSLATFDRLLVGRSPCSLTHLPVCTSVLYMACLSGLVIMLRHFVESLDFQSGSTFPVPLSQLIKIFSIEYSQFPLIFLVIVRLHHYSHELCPKICYCFFFLIAFAN